MVVCAAFACNSRSELAYAEKLGFFSFPSESKRKKVWANQLNRSQYVVTKNSKLCSKHFEDDAFVRTRAFAESIGYTGKFNLRLKPEAIPTIFFRYGKSSPQKRASASSIEAKRFKSQVWESCKKAVAPGPDVIGVEDNLSSAVPFPVTEPSMPVVSSTPPHDGLSCLAEAAAHLTRLDPTQESFNMQTQTPYNLVRRCSRYIQCGVESEDRAVQTGDPRYYSGDKILFARTATTCAPLVCPPRMCLDDSFVSDLSEADARDPDWLPGEEDDASDAENDSGQPPVQTERKFIVFESCLDKLMDKCVECGGTTLLLKRTVGTYIVYRATCCVCDEEREWGSQPMTGAMPYGNLCLASAIVLAGASANCVLRVFDFAGIVNISPCTFTKIQGAYVTPSIMSVWRSKQAGDMQKIRTEARTLKLAGDARCCTPGHTAKFGSYSVMDMETGKILDIQLVQSNEVKNSYAMEKEGLIRALTHLADNQLVVGDLVTDRHSSIKKMMREEYPEVNHWFDVWHVAKGVYKKLEAAGKKKDCEKVKEWARSISNHMYWCASSSKGDGDMLLEKWLSILNHVTNVHEGHGDNYPQCQHEPLDDRSWMVKGRKPFAELEKVVTGRLLIKDVKKLSPDAQTSSLESFHSVVCNFAPKSVHFQHAQMEARICLAGLHFNENASRQQAVTKAGTPRYAISYPKARRGAAVAKEIKEAATFGYVDEILTVVFARRDLNKSYTQAFALRDREDPVRPRPLAQSTPRRQPKDDVIRAHRARFSTT